MLKRFDQFISVVLSALRALAKPKVWQRQRKSIIGHLITLMFIAAPLGHAQTYQTDWYVTGSGGGLWQSADYQVDDSTIQPIAEEAAWTNFQYYAELWVKPVPAREPCEYLIGDINGDNERTIGDVFYGIRYFKENGKILPKDSCFIDSTQTYLYVAGDCNGDCRFNFADITRLIQYFKGNMALAYCRFSPTTLPPY